MSRLSRFRFLRFSADGITFGESSPASGSESKQNDVGVKFQSLSFYVNLTVQNRSQKSIVAISSKPFLSSAMKFLTIEKNTEKQSDKIDILLLRKFRSLTKCRNTMYNSRLVTKEL